MPQTGSDTAEARAAWGLSVVKGPQADAFLTLPPGRWLIGCCGGGSILLADPAAGPQDDAVPCRAELVIGTDGRAALTARGADLRLGRRSLRIGKPHRLSPAGAEVVFGDTVVRLQPPVGATASPARWRSAPLALVLLLALSGAALSGAAAFGTSALRQPPAAAPLAMAARRAPAAPAAAAETFNAHLASAGLHEAFRAEAEAASVALRGGAPADPALKARWREAIAWYDARYPDGPGLVVDRNATAAAAPPETPPLRVGGYAYGPHAFVVTTEGHRLTEGAVLDGGWRLERIAADGIVLRHGPRSLTLRP